MNFICDKCKQKYHVADEKLQGRAVTRFRCKKCDHIIELEAPTQTVLGSASATTSSSPVPARPPTIAVPAVRPGTPSGKSRPVTTTGPAFGVAGTTPARAATMATPAARSGAASNLGARPAPADRSWYAGIRDVPVGPLSRSELAARVQSGEVTPDTLVWREGLDDWRPLQKVVELSDLLRTSPAASGPSEAARPSASTLRPSVLDDDEEATRVSGLDPSLAGIMGKGRARESPGKAETSKALGTGLSPLARAPTAPARAPTASEGPELRDAALPSARGPDATVPEVSSGSSPEACETPSGAKRVGREPSSSERVGREPSSSEKRPSAESSGAIKRPEDELLDELFAKPAKASGAPASRPPVESLPLLTPPASPAGAASRSTPPPPNALAAPSLPAPEPSASLAPAPEPSASLAPAPEPVIAPLSSPELSTVPTQQAPQGGSAALPDQPSVRGLPPIVWFMMAGTLFVGLLGGLYLGRMNTSQHAPRPEATPTSPHPVPPPPRVMPSDAGASDAALAVPRGEAPTNTAVQQSAMALAPAAPRAEALLQAFQRSDVVHTCWASTLAQRPDLAPTTVTIDLHADARGRLTRVEVAQSPDPRFDACLRARLGTVASIGNGEAVDARATVSLAIAP